MKTFARGLLRRAGYELLHRTDDPVLSRLRSLHETLRLQPDDPLQWEDALPQPAALCHLRTLLRLHRIDLVVDVGANRGQFAQRVRSLGFRGRIVSFEPQSQLRTILEGAAARDADWKIMPCALGAADGTVTLQVFRNDTFSSLHAINDLGRHRFPDLVVAEGSEPVAIRTLDGAWPEVSGGQSCRVLLKTDTQGHDLAVLQGATGVLPCTHAILTEAALQPIYDDAPLYGELSRWLADRGFVPSGLFPISHRREDMALIELDAFFTRSVSST